MRASKIVIPARYAASRLPGKPLLDIAGKPMIAHVCERALEAEAGEVVVATDDERIIAAVAGLPVTAVMTRADHQNGAERITEAADILGWADETLVVNLQGDEPLMQPALIRQLAELLDRHGEAQVATLAAPIHAIAEAFDPNAVKVVLDRHNRALYFSRAPIPWRRDSFATQAPALAADFPWLRHIGVYAYSAGFLRRYIAWPATPLERIEALEQLRILWMGESILVLPVQQAPEGGVDTEADLARVRGRYADAVSQAPSPSKD
jgi:3-deoxy-manno-octulosonate cytidylyltransferase (CMP-KDO synthetase)